MSHEDPEEHWPPRAGPIGKLGIFVAVGVTLVLAALGVGVWLLVRWFSR